MNPNKLFAIYLIKKLQDAGHIAVLVGGCVRDELLGLEPKDFDVATSAAPEQVKELFQTQFRIIPVGESFGVIRILDQKPHASEQTCTSYKGKYCKREVEIATFRTEHGYSDGRRPDKVEFVKDITADLARRDLTINAIAFDPISGEYHDPFNGRKDLLWHVITTVGKPSERFAEDYLRMLRAIRFACRFNARLDEETSKAIENNAENITKISKERIAKELTLIISGPNPGDGLQLLFKTGLMRHIIPELDETERFMEFQAAAGRYDNYPWDSFIFKVDRAEELGVCSAEIAYAILLMNCRNAEEIAERLCLTSAGVNLSLLLDLLTFYMDVDLLAEMISINQYNIVSMKHFWDTVNFVKVLYPSENKTDYASIYNYYKRDSPLKIGETPIINGNFLISQGLAPGKHFGDIINAGVRAQLNGEFDNRGAVLWIADYIQAKALQCSSTCKKMSGEDLIES